jgi:hypothetical protein
MENGKISTFRIEITAEVVSDLRQRPKNTRWSYQMKGTNWEAGTDLDYLKDLVDYWRETYDWRKHETVLNQFARFKTEIDGIGIHFIYERGKGPNPFPLFLTHGYPDSFYRFAKIIPMLTDPESFGGRVEDADAPGGHTCLGTWIRYDPGVWWGNSTCHHPRRSRSSDPNVAEQESDRDRQLYPTQ